MKTISFRFAAILVMLLAPALASAQVYKCTVAGEVTFQDAPCAAGQERPVDTRPAADGVTGLRDDAARMAAKEARAAREQAAQAAVPPRRKTMQETRDYRRENCTPNRTPAGRPSWGVTCR